MAISSPNSSLPHPSAGAAVPVGSAASRLRHALFGALDAAGYGLIGLALCGELGAVLANIFARAFLHTSILWTDEVGSLVLAVLAFIGGAVAYRHDHHSAVLTVVNMLPSRERRLCAVAVDWLVLVIAAVTCYLAVGYMQTNLGQTTPILGIPSWGLGLPLIVGMALMALYAVERLSRREHRTVLWLGLVALALTAGAVAARPVLAAAMTGSLPIVAALLLFLVVVLIGLPVGLALVFSSLLYLIPSSTPLVALPQNLNDGTANFVLLALPFFILAGGVMEQGGISIRLVSLARALVGHLRGGLLQVAVVSVYLVSGLSGSKAADIAAVGPVLRTMLEREGIAAEEGGAVLAASAAMGETIPPSLGLLVLGSITTLSMGALFTAGLVPAAVIAICLMLLIHVRAKRLGMPRSARASGPELGRATLSAVLPLLMPVMLYVGIRTGMATPTEISALAVAYGLVLALGYRTLGLRAFGSMVGKASMTSGMILFILAGASSFSWVLSAAQVPQVLVASMESWHAGPVIFMLVSLGGLVVLGSLLEGLPAVLILAPLLLPVAAKLGVNQLHYAIVLLIAIGIGSFLPPLGVGFYVACTIARTKIGPTARVMGPYALVLVIGLLIVAFVPAFTLALPNAFAR